MITVIKSQVNSKVIPRKHWSHADKREIKTVKKAVKNNSLPSITYFMEFKILVSNIYNSWKEHRESNNPLINPGDFFEKKWKRNYGDDNYVEADYEDDSPTIRKSYVKRAFLELVVEETDYGLPAK